MAWKVSNFADSALRQSAALADTTIFIDADDVDLLALLGVGDKISAVLSDATYREIIHITAWNTDGTLTVERGKETTAARDWASGTLFTATPTAETLQAILNTTTAVVFTGTATNVGNLYTVDVGVGNTLPSFVDGEEITFVINADNTDAVTLNVTDGTTTIATKNVVHQDGQALASGDFQADWLAVVRYVAADDRWVIVSDVSYNEHAFQLNDGPVPGINRHLNGRVDFWKNGTSFATPASLTETADGWVVVYDGTIGTFSVAQQTFTLGQTDVPGDPKYFLRWDHSSAGSGSTIRRLRVKLPGVEWRNGEEVSRSIYLKADASRTVTAKLIQHFGTGGAPSADVEADTEDFSVTTSWQRFELTATLPSITGKTLGSGGDDGLYVTLDLPLNVSMTIDVTCDDIRQGHIPGLQSATFPVPTWLGGTGGSFEDIDAVSDAMIGVVHIAGDETITGEKTFTADLNLEAAAPRLLIRESDQAADEKLWDLSAVGGDLLLRSRTDADGAGVTVVSVDRGAGTAITSVTLGGTALFVPPGSSTVPGLAGSNDTDTGFEWAGSNQIYLLNSGAQTWLLASNLVAQAGGAVRAGGGSAASPTIAFANATTHGLFNNGGVGVAFSGVLVATFFAASLTMNTGVDIVLPSTAHAPTSVFSAGYRGTPVVSGNSAYAFPLAEAGHTVYHDEAGARTWTIPANASVAHPIGTTFILDNTGNAGAAGAITLAITSDTLARGDGLSGTGSRTIPASATATIRKVAATRWVITGIFN